MVRTKNDLGHGDGDGAKQQPPSKKASPAKGHKTKDFWVGCCVKMKDHVFNVTSPEQQQLIGCNSYKHDVFGAITAQGTKSPFHWFVEFGDGVGLLEVDDKKLFKHPQHQKNPRFAVADRSPPPRLENQEPSISFEPLNIRAISKEKSLDPANQEQMDGYQVDSVKLTTDPKQQTTLTQAYGDPTKSRPLLKTGLLHYAKNWNLYKQVRYLPTRAKAKDQVQKQQQQDRPPAISKPPKEMPQIPVDVNEMLSDDNAELGPMTQTQTQTLTQTDDLVDTPSSTQGSAVDAVIVEETTTHGNDGSGVLVEKEIARDPESEQSQVLISESQIIASPDISVVGAPTEENAEPKIGVSSEAPKQPTLPEQAAAWAQGHDDSEVVVINQDCLEAFLKDQHDYSTTMDDRAKALLASHPSETQVKLRHFYGMEDEFGNEVITPEVEKN